MELWLRTQNKHSLVKPDYITTYETDYNTIIDRFENISIIAIKEDEQITLGCYATIERALEVLDEIQNIIRGKYATSFDYKTALKGFEKEDTQYMLEQMAVYEMPKE